MTPTVEVVIPAARGNLAQRLVDSLLRGSLFPDVITLVGNEPTDIVGARVVRYETDYLMGPGDVCLRRNIGIFFSDADIIIFQDDDQLAPPNMVESAVNVIQCDGYVWGHHRYIDFGDDPWQIWNLPPEAGHSRESSPNREHGWQSCYAGMFGAKRDLLMQLGGFDMVFAGRIGNEDQQLGRRLLRSFGREHSYIYEPPFAWHPTQVEQLPRPAGRPDFDLGMVMDSPVPVEPFDPARVHLKGDPQWQQ